MISSEVRTVDGVALSVSRGTPSGEARDVAVVVAHGFGATKDEPRVDGVARALRDAGFSTVTYDARGHGESGGASTLGVLERHDVAAAPTSHASSRRGWCSSARRWAPSPCSVTRPGRDDVAGVVTVACPATWTLPRNARGVLAAAMTQTRLGRSVARRRMAVRIATPDGPGRPAGRARAAVRAPVAVVHGAVDPFIGVDAATPTRGEHAGGPVRRDGRARARPCVRPRARLRARRSVDAVEWVLGA